MLTESVDRSPKKRSHTNFEPRIWGSFFQLAFRTQAKKPATPFGERAPGRVLLQCWRCVQLASDKVSRFDIQADDAPLRTHHWASRSCHNRPLNCISMSASIRDRLIALAQSRTVSAPAQAEEAHSRSDSNDHPISLLERLYRLRLVSAGVLWRAG
jgi:hypothetical protein